MTCRRSAAVRLSTSRASLSLGRFWRTGGVADVMKYKEDLNDDDISLPRPILSSSLTTSKIGQLPRVRR